MNEASDNLDITVIIVSYNTKDLTLKAIETLNAQTHCGYEVIVFDNASDDGSADAVNAKFPGVNLIESVKNVGFAAANNDAARYANGKYILLLNPDTEILDHAIDRLFEFAEANPECGIWGGRTLYGDLTLNPESCWMRQTFWSLFCQASGLSSLFRRSTFFNSEGIGGWDRKGERNVDIVSGCFLLIRVQLWRDLGGFNPKYFMYGEDADICLRSHALGASPRVTSKATIIHYGGKSEKLLASKIVKLIKAKMDLISDHFSYNASLAKFLLYLWPLNRLIVYSALAILRGGKATERKEVWQEVFKRRSEWVP